MARRTYTAKIQIDGVALTARGLSVADVAALHADAPDAMKTLFTAFTKDNAGIDDLILALPEIGARIIATALDLPDKWVEIREALPSDQIDALETISAITFKTEWPGEKSGDPSPRARTAVPKDFSDWLMGLRRQVSLLVEHGHRDAESYSIGALLDEAAIVDARVAQQQAVTAMLYQSALATVPNMGLKPSTTRKAASRFSKLITSFTGGVRG